MYIEDLGRRSQDKIYINGPLFSKDLLNGRDNHIRMIVDRIEGNLLLQVNDGPVNLAF